MLHLRIVAPSGLTPQVLDLFGDDDAVCNVVHLADAARKPRGDLVLCDVARARVSGLIAALNRLGLAASGSIEVLEIEAAPSAIARLAQSSGRRLPADAVVWEEVEARAELRAVLSFSYVAFMLLAIAIAAVGILTDSLVLIVGAMVIGPDYGPVSGLCVGIVERNRQLVGRALTSMVVGFGAGILIALLGTVLLRLTPAAPHRLSPDDHQLTLFIANPNVFAVIVALLAGIGGILSLTQARAGALIGVLISVTTIPAAANVGVAIAYLDWAETGGATAQLAINLSALAAVGVLTLYLQRARFLRRQPPLAGA